VVGGECLHCAVCDACAGAGRVCRLCELCIEHAEHELSTRQAQLDRSPTVAEFMAAPGFRYLSWSAREYARAEEWRGAFRGMLCARRVASPYAQRDPGTGRMYRPLRTYVEHSLYDVTRERWSEWEA
jgi:hypothetical protein